MSNAISVVSFLLGVFFFFCGVAFLPIVAACGIACLIFADVAIKESDVE